MAMTKSGAVALLWCVLARHALAADEELGESGGSTSVGKGFQAEREESLEEFLSDESKLGPAGISSWSSPSPLGQEALLSYLVPSSPAAALEALGGADLATAGHFSAPDRRLWGLPQLNLDSFTSAVSSFLGPARNQLAAATDHGAVVQVLDGWQGYLQQGVGIVQTCWEAFMGLSGKLYHIYQAYMPLGPMLDSMTGMLQLFTNKMHINQLSNFVQELLSTSDVLRMVADACQKVSGAFGEIAGLISSAWARLGSLGGGRRLQGYNLLSGLDFNAIYQGFYFFVSQAKNIANTLDSISNVLSPVLTQVSRATAPGRRLAGEYDIMGNQQRYASAINQIVPAWQRVEKLGMNMCPEVSGAYGAANSLKCRVRDFVTQGGMLGMLGQIIPSCPTAGPSQVACPTKAYAGGGGGRGGALMNSLGNISNPLGLVLALLVALGVLGGGAAAAQAARPRNRYQGF